MNESGGLILDEEEGEDGAETEVPAGVFMGFFSLF